MKKTYRKPDTHFVQLQQRSILLGGSRRSRKDTKSQSNLVLSVTETVAYETKMKVSEMIGADMIRNYNKLRSILIMYSVFLCYLCRQIANILKTT